MGSGSSRNRKDAVERRLIITKHGDAGGAGGANGINPAVETKVCPLTFEIQLPSKPFLPVRTKPLELKNESGVLWIYFKALRVVDLEPKLNALILMCVDKKGFEYVGVVRADETGKRYAEFTRSTGV